MSFLRRDRLVVPIVALVTFAIAHQVALLLAYPVGGVDLAVAGGHGIRWLLTLVSILGIGAVVAVAGLWRLWAIRRLVASDGRVRGHVRISATTSLTADFLRIVRVAIPLALAIFVVNENLERVWAGLPADGLAVLGTAGAAIPALFALFGVFASLVAALYRWRRDILEARLAAARAPRPRRPLQQRVPWDVRPLHGVDLHATASRAPPRSLRLLPSPAALVV
jgi:hypothetical protein